jgi:hypothetical protein
MVRVKVKRDAHPRAPNINFWESCAPISPSRTSAWFVHARVVAGAVIEVPCQAPWFPGSTIAVRTHPPFDPRLSVNARCALASVRDPPGTLRACVLRWQSRLLGRSGRNRQLTHHSFSSLEYIYASTRVVLGHPPPDLRTRKIRPSYLQVSQTSSGLRGLPHGWWIISAVSMQCRYESLGKLDPTRANGQ